MKKFLCTATLVCLICIAGCGQSQSNMIEDLPSKLPEESHNVIDHEEESHDVIDHEEEHLDDPTTVTPVSFVSGMGCSDPNCTDASHHHDCPTDCSDYEHHHNCPLDCADESHHHNGANNANGSGQHHTKQHHGNDHH